MTFRVYEDHAGAFRWQLLGRNGEIVAQGEGYTRRRDVLRAIRRLRAEVWRAPVVG